MNDTKKTLKRYVVTTLAASAFAGLIMYLKGIGGADSLNETFKILTDAFTVPGVLLIMISALIWVSKDGFFDGMGFAVSRVGNMFLPLVGAVNNHENFYEYKQRKAKNRPSGYSFLLFVGIAFFVIAMIFYVIYKITA